MILARTNMVRPLDESLRVGIVQRVLPHYRVPFFNLLGTSIPGPVQLLCGAPSPGETLQSRPELLVQVEPIAAQNRHISKGRTYICWQAGALPWLNAFQPDILILEANPRIISNYAIIRWAKNNRRKIIGWGLGALPSSLPSLIEPFRERLHKFYYGCFDGMVAYSNKAKSDYIQRGVAPASIFVAHNAVDTSEAAPFLEWISDNPDLLRKWKLHRGLADNRITVLSVGRLERRKRVDRLIRACRPIKDQVQLLIVGDGPARAELEELSAQLRTPAIFTGACYGEDLSYCFGAGDVFVMPGLGGLATQQAMSYGKPVIVGKADGTEIDLVRDSINGYLIEPSTENITRTLKYIINNSALRKKMAEESLDIIHNEINLGHMAESFRNCIQKVLGSECLP